MTDDEAFIRSVVDNPGDDLPRLAYADWLDDRADPRGPYLRAEREAVATGDTSRMRELAAGLDPVWVARVSRPPLGVCCDHVRFTGAGPRLGPADVAAAEAQLGVAFPDPYRAFLLNHNGGTPDPFEFVLPGGGGAVERVHLFEPLFPAGPDDVLVVSLTRQVWAKGGPAAVAAAVYVGWDPFCGSHSARRYLLATAGPRAGRLLAWEDWTPDEPAWYAARLPDWLAALRHVSPDWVRYIYRGDRAGLRAWLDAGGGVEARDGDAGRVPLDFAAEYDQPDIARDLFARGARVDRTFWFGMVTNHPLVQWMERVEQALEPGR